MQSLMNRFKQIQGGGIDIWFSKFQPSKQSDTWVGGSRSAWRADTWVGPYKMLCLFLICLFSVTSAYAALPEFITYQGYVVDSGGTPLDGSFDVTFRIFDDEAAAVEAAIWTETKAAVAISSGEFSVEIGSASAESVDPLNDLAFDKPYWLSVEIESGGELLPRQALEMVPYAFRTRDGMTRSEDNTVSGNNTFTGTADFSGGLTAPELAPVGSIVAWHKSFANTPELPENWVECNGQTIVDAGSIYNGQTVPNINGTGRFLKGSSTSGVENAADTHAHTGKTGNNIEYGGGKGQVDQTYPLNPHTHTIFEDTAGDPINFTVVWIMRIK